MLDRLAELATLKVLAAFLVVLAALELVLRQVVSPEYQWVLNVAGLLVALSLLVIGGAPLIRDRLERRREEE